MSELQTTTPFHPTRGRGRGRGSRSRIGNGRGRGANRLLESCVSDVDDIGGLDDELFLEPASSPATTAIVAEIIKIPYTRENWSGYVIHFFENTRIPDPSKTQHSSAQLLADCKLCITNGECKISVSASIRAPSNLQRQMERNYAREWKKYIDNSCRTPVAGQTPRFRGVSNSVDPDSISKERQKNLDDGLVTMIVTDN